MNPRAFDRLLKQAVFLPVLLLLLLAAVLLTEVRATFDATKFEQQSDQNISDLEGALKLIIDQETGLRGYQITEDPSFLDPYNRAKPAITAAFERLKNDFAEQQSQEEELAAARRAYLEWTQYAENEQALVQRQGQYRALSLNAEGKQRMDDIRERFAQLIQHAARLRDERSAAVRDQVRRIVETTIVLTVLLGILIGMLSRRLLHRVSDSYVATLKAAESRSEELYNSQQSYYTTLQSIGDAVIVCDGDGRVTFMNRVAQDLCGVNQVEADGKALAQVFNIVNETTRAVVENPVDKVRRLNRVVGLANHTVLLRPDGTEINIDDSGAPIRDQHGELTGVVLVFRDITQSRKTAQALLASEKLAVAGRLSATIAHEIHNPLDSVANLLYLLGNHPSAEDAQRYISLATQELRRVTETSRTMLSLYREPKAPILLDLKDLLESVLVLLDRKMQDSGVHVTRDMPDEVRVEGFPAELRQVFTNLLTNAIEAAGRDGSISVALRAQDGDAGAIVEVSDNGPGIPDEVRMKIFAPFFTTKGEQGTGLGLWISRGIINKHSGSIEAISRTEAEKHGTTMRVTLPAKAASLLTETAR